MIIALLSRLALAAPWSDETATLLGDTGGWSNKVHVADLTGDGLPDVVFANGGDYSSPGEPQKSHVFRNEGAGKAFTRITDEVFGDEKFSARSIHSGDLDGDGIIDLFVGTTWETSSRVFLGTGGGAFAELVGAAPAVGSFGDAELGDLDGDGDLDVFLADWGAGDPFEVAARPRVWINDGSGMFTEDLDRVTDVAVGFSWDLELWDVDGDWDLDALVSCKVCDGSFLFRNDGQGVFSHDPLALPQYTNNYDIELMDLDGDGDDEIVTINDGPGLRERVWDNDGAGVFTDRTAEWWPNSENIGEDDNVSVFADVDADGDADFLIGSLGPHDRVMLNDGTGALTLWDEVLDGPTTGGTLGIAWTDFDGDGRLDVVMAQGEVAFPDRLWLGTDELAVDTVAPVLVAEAGPLVAADPGRFRATLHDRHTPVGPVDFDAVVVKLTTGDLPLRHDGGALWSADDPLWAESPDGVWQICATDRAGNEACGDLHDLDVPGDHEEGTDGDDDSDSDSAGEEPGACGCATPSPWTPGWLGIMLLAALSRRRR
jgi:MYXO-CTERM domain-containing protein